MSGILVVAFLVHCGHSLLLCDEINMRNLAFRDMGDCRARLGGIVADQQRTKGASRVVMGKCHYLLVEPPREPEVARHDELRHPSRSTALAASGGAGRARSRQID